MFSSKTTVFLIIISFSSGLDSATNKVIATKAPLEIVNLFLDNKAFLLKYKIRLTQKTLNSLFSWFWQGLHRYMEMTSC